jgi:hypothetical protein
MIRHQDPAQIAFNSLSRFRRATSKQVDVRPFFDDFQSQCRLSDAGFPCYQSLGMFQPHRAIVVRFPVFLKCVLVNVGNDIIHHQEAAGGKALFIEMAF